MCREGSVDCVIKLVLIHVVQGHGKSWKTPDMYCTNPVAVM